MNAKKCELKRKLSRIVEKSEQEFSNYEINVIIIIRVVWLIAVALLPRHFRGGLCQRNFSVYLRRPLLISEHYANQPVFVINSQTEECLGFSANLSRVKHCWHLRTENSNDVV